MNIWKRISWKVSNYLIIFSLKQLLFWSFWEVVLWKNITIYGRKSKNQYNFKWLIKGFQRIRYCGPHSKRYILSPWCFHLDPRTYCYVSFFMSVCLVWEQAILTHPKWGQCPRVTGRWKMGTRNVPQIQHIIPFVTLGLISKKDLKA